jgi:hypothetical protein
VRKLRWIILFVLIALGGGTLWLLLGRESIEEGRCRLVRKKADPSSQLMGLAWQFLQPLNGKPESLQSPPAGFDRPCYYQIRSGDRLIPAVVDLTESPNLCLDTNGDGVLAQEMCFTARHIRETKTSSSSWRFGPISLSCPDSPGNVESRFYAYGYRTDTPGPLSILPVFYRTGKLRLEGRTYRVALADGDCDGRFNSLLALPLERPWRLPACDVFAIDLNHNGAFEISVSARSEVMPLGQLVQIGSDYYAIGVASDGRGLTLSKTEPQLGTLVLESGDAAVELKLWSDAADQYLAPGHQWQLPAGKYMAIDAALEQRDASGYLRTLPCSSSSAMVHLGPLNFFVIKPGETTSVRIGSPFTVKADVQQAGQGEVTINALLVGCAGEEYQVGWRQGGAALPSPAFKIVDEKGTVLAAGKFEYG